MEVITINNETFSRKSTELISQIDFNPDIIVGILNGGGYVVNEIKNEKRFEHVQFESIKLQRDNRLKNNYFTRLILKRLPYSITNWLRVYESNKAKKAIETLNLENLSNSGINFKFNSNSKKTVDNILIIDDAIDTGKTMFIAKKYLIKRFPEAKIKTAVISWTIEKSIIVPDYYLFKNSLVRYPWSKDYKEKDFEKKSFSS
ncbi:phosphoribosyltransferase family protein [Flavivirga amylovorans]|uniref:Phosphoribosyltransferase family protein n=1 Tax=Flavivirga amylovorans TaxID=870486 RepID=A0ABT8WXG4_9FLAO|nr:phosphoribosyltransferase family protein [Flavivirga amylovorans]MDO5986345.1 phosphoribosyltransferase family protein [Flavivirga amylovorans]